MLSLTTIHKHSLLPSHIFSPSSLSFSFILNSPYISLYRIYLFLPISLSLPPIHFLPHPSLSLSLSLPSLSLSLFLSPHISLSHNTLSPSHHSLSTPISPSISPVMSRIELHQSR